MNKVLHEYWYTFGKKEICHGYLIVKRETPKMFYGDVSDEFFTIGAFSTKKEHLNKVVEIRNNFKTVYRVQLDIENEHEARQRAKELFYEYIMRIAQSIIDD